MAARNEDMATLPRCELAALKAWNRGVRGYREIARETGQSIQNVKRMLSLLRACGLIDDPSHRETEEPEPTPEQHAEFQRRVRVLHFAKRFAGIGNDEFLPSHILEAALPEGGSNEVRRAYLARRRAGRETLA